MYKFSKILLLIPFIVILSCNAQNNKPMEKDGKKANKLINESSPYLLQHAYNPVNWQAWNKESLKQAKDEQKLMIISIGYAACHWCHVMEHESFEDSTVAALMNRDYVNIKIDREERPDIDQIYMNAAYLTLGRGGWPLNAIALPDGRPVFAGTYYPKKDWLSVLNFFQQKYNDNPLELEEQAAKISNGIAQIDLPVLNTEKQEYVIEDIDRIFNNWKSEFDLDKGGKLGSPKFPMPSMYQMLLRYHYHTGNSEALEIIDATLTNMANGGIFDQLGGGFARYSTDQFWKVPHFEKMLYDNGQLVSLYADAYRVSQNPLYKEAVEKSLSFIERELMDSSGGFYSSLDADSEGEEGLFYVWEAEEIRNHLGEDAELYFNYYSITDKGNWEHKKNILLRNTPHSLVASAAGLSDEALKEKIAVLNAKLFKERAKKIRPGLDDKVLTSWNGLMLIGYVDAYKAFGNQHYLDMAIDNANFLINNCLQPNNRINRNYKNGKSNINGFLDDYSYLIQAFIALYQVTFDEKYLNKAKEVMDYAITHFQDPNTKMFYYTSDIDEKLIARKFEISDNVIPASNSSIAKSLFQLGHYFYDRDYVLLSRQMLANVLEKIPIQTSYYTNWLDLMSQMTKEPYEVAIVGPNWKAFRQEFDQHYLPNVLFLGGENEGSLQLLANKKIDGQTTVYVCQNKICKLPVTSVTEALKLIEK